MKVNTYPANQRGRANHGWLKANYSFSFSSYYNPENTNFGKLRVLNDDFIAGGAGFPTHAHANMEIITIPLKGALAHKDSTGSKGVIRPNEVQFMSAGRGVEHSEFNHIANGETNILQIWIFPKEENTTPKYEQQYFDAHHRQNKWQFLVSNKHPGAIGITQDAVISRTQLQQGKELDYTLQYKSNGVYIFVIDGQIKINNEILGKRDAIGLEQIDIFALQSIKDSDVLCIEVPMN